MTANIQHHMPSHSHRARSWSIALLMSSVLLVSGCGGSGSGSGSGSSSSSSSSDSGPGTTVGGGSTLRISVAGGGAVSADGAPACTNAGGSNCTPSLTAGASHTLTATPNSGYVFSGWYSNTTSAGLGTSFSPTTPYAFSKSAATQHVTAIFTPTAATSTPPVQLYTDITSGPLTGGENNKGIYLSVFGKNLNSTGAGTTTKVYINNIEVDNYRDLAGASYRGRTDLEKVTAQLGTLGAAVSGTSLPIMVVVNGRIATNGDSALAFTPLAGNIYFVDPANGVDTSDTSTGGTFSAPFRSAQKAGFGLSFSILPASTSGAYGRVRAGDFIVLRGGTYTGTGAAGYFMMMLNKSGCPIGNNCSQGGGISSGPITVMGYPGETAYINRTYSPGDGYGGGFSSADTARQATGYGAWWVITNVKIESGFADGPVNTQRGDLNTTLGSHWRVVNNEMTGSSCSLQSLCKAGGIAGGGQGNYWVGNYIHDVYDKPDGSTNLENHGAYIDSDGSFEIAYNRFNNIAGGNGIQSYNNSTGRVSNIKIHHNIVNGVGKHGININNAVTGVVIFNNVIMNTDYSGLRFNSDELSGAKVYNNTFYNTDRINGFAVVRAALSNDANLSSGAIEIKNNVFVPGNGSRYYIGGSVGFSTVASGFSNNLWYGGTGTLLGGSNVTGNPLFNSTTSGAEDLHLQTGSPAIGAGTSSVSGIVVNDFDITTSRPQSSSYDIGAYER